MEQYIDRVLQDLSEKNLQSYWQDFKMVAYAIYDKQTVYLFNHPSVLSGQLYLKLLWDSRFSGCTLILFENYPTTIVDVHLYDEYESIYSILVHELFHGFQYINGERRFPDELLGMTYPMTEINVELRNQERMSLLHAVLATDADSRDQWIREFIGLREKRRDELRDYLNYELRVEAIEGPAWYVELMAYHEKSSQSIESHKKSFISCLQDRMASSQNIRKSCYHSRLAICLLLDEVDVDWKQSFMISEWTVYDLLKQNFPIAGEDTSEVTITQHKRQRKFARLLTKVKLILLKNLKH
ncbi:hypothetical protein [Alkalicoccobacillus porphyridii]|uniref:Uncharacterized protein n=1 Tax=Alkalicoccobacillus porphyridii TaxID=2597270 RepID=A0A554A257_9BACI|nr:hypothetical protein [Alkalicoccobacillus porphyridii]TSB47736.1 hypothetical protein FN960_04250 [Alkalicoccobacillus porphyridii]